MESELIFEGDLGNVFNPEATTNQVDVEASDTIEEIADGGVEGIPMVEDVDEGDIIVNQDGSIEGPISMGAPGILDQPDVEISLEDELKSTEKLDRSSPDLWPQNLPSAAQFIIAKNQSKTGEQENLGIWAQGLDPEDINLLHQFGSLTSSSLIEEVKKLQNIAYQLGLEEAKEMTRGKLLHVLDDQDLSNCKKDKETHVQRLWK